MTYIAVPRTRHDLAGGDRMPGARFVRADLHVHTVSDNGGPASDPAAYIAEALARDVRVLGITDHNHIDNVRAVVDAASGQEVLVLPGIEITTHQGHILALFGPNEIDTLRDVERSLDLRADPIDGSRRSTRSLLQLVGDIHGAGGLAILAHVDRDEGLHSRVSRTQGL
jgi:predicted metal-dependent phosphoesterase TrpH